MAQRRARIASRIGLHARPAAIFAKRAAAVPVAVTITKEGRNPVAAKSLLGLLTLGAQCGDEVLLTAEGSGAEDALEELAAVLETDHDSPAAG